MTDTLLITDLIVGMLIISGISMACLGVYGRRFTARIPAAVPYTLLMGSAAAWAILYALDLLTASLPLKILFHILRFLVLPFIAVIELWLVISYVKKTEWLRRDWAAAVLLIPVAAAILGITSPLHSLFRYNFSINTSGPVPVLQYTDSPLYTVYILYSLALLVLAILILIVESRKRGTLREEQTILLLIALAFPTVVNYLYVFGMTPLPGVNLTAPLLWIAAILYTVALFRYRFLDIIPIARSRLIETMSTPMLVLDPGGRVIDLNPAACSLFSTTPAEAVGRAVDGFSPDWQDFLSLCRSDRTSHADLTRSHDGGMQYYTGSVEQIRTPSGESEGRLVLLQDVTGEISAEKALRVSEEKFRILFTQMIDGSALHEMVYDGFGNPTDYIILDVNPAYERITGLKREDIIGKRSKEVYGVDTPPYIDTYATVAATGTPEKFEVYFAPLNKHFSLSVYSPQNGRFATIFDDVTDRKQIEEQREHLIHELELKNSELDRFTHTVSHDLKSPLVTIRAFLNLLEEDVKSGNSPGVKMDIARMDESAEKLEGLITTLLALSRSGRTVDAPASIPFTDVVSYAVQLLDAPLKGRGVTLVIPDTLPVIAGDRHRLVQTMTNLLDNAIKYMGDQDAPRIEIGVEKDCGMPVFFVTDNGMGIAKENLQKVFGLYERFSPHVPGTGIGLATVKRIVEAHGGKIWVESEGPGKGSTFRFTLPGVPVIAPITIIPAR